MQDKSEKSPNEIDPTKTLTIPEFDPKILNQSFFRMSLFGSSYSGKSYFIKYIYPYISPKYSKVVVFTPQFNSEFYDDLLYDVKDKKTGNILTQCFKFYTSDFKMAVQSIEMIRNSNTSGEDNILVIMDDMISNKASKNDDFMRLFASCRHSNISLIYCIQFFTAEYSNNSMRANSNVVVTTRPSTIRSRAWVKSNLIEEFVGKNMWEADTSTIKTVTNKIYGKVFAETYDKLVCYNGDLMKCTGTNMKFKK